jgi:malate dehydrogenase
MYIGVPCVLGKNGLERIIELKLNEEEKALFDESAGKYKTGLEELQAL